MQLSEILGELNQKYPFDSAESWDNVGLLIGDPNSKVKGIVVSVNLGAEALAEAKKARANLIICHHPPIFKPTHRIVESSSPYILEAIRNKISVIALHTNFDLHSEDTMTKLAADLKVTYEGALARRDGREIPESLQIVKFITYVPTEALEKVRKAVFEAGAGHIGSYSRCSFQSEGMGTFEGSEATNPAIGKPGRFEAVLEQRLEVVLPIKKLDKVISAARKAHPYEEMAYDVFAFARPVRSVGYGFIGKPAGVFDFHKFLKNVKQTFYLKQLVIQQASDLKAPKVAFSPGSGSSFVKTAISRGVKVYVTGEIGYHQMLEAKTAGLSLVLLGHGNSERFFVETLGRWCQGWAKTKLVYETVQLTLT
ncbi:MAG: Nif3-like dinuclear metal center hexameric protein [Bacteriovoracia bacterium]